MCVLGDSYVEAFQVESDSTFLALTEDALRRTLPFETEVLNLGRSGMTQTEELLVLRRDVQRLEPDMVIVVFMPYNDVDDVSRRTAGSLLRPFFRHTSDGDLILDRSFNETREYRFKARLNVSKQRSALVSLLAERYNALGRSRRIAARDRANGGEVKVPFRLALCTATPGDIAVENYRLNKRLLSEMNEWCKARGIRFMIVSGNCVTSADGVSRYSEIDATFDSMFYDHDLASFADSLRCEHLGLQGAFEGHWGEGGGALHWGHWNYAGHRLVASALVAKLEAALSEEPASAKREAKIPSGS